MYGLQSMDKLISLGVGVFGKNRSPYYGKA